MMKNFRYLGKLVEFFKDLEILSNLHLKTKPIPLDAYLKNIKLDDSQWLYFFVTTPF